MNRRQEGFAWLALGLLASAAAALLGATTQIDHPGVIGALTWTGRLAFLVFLIPLFASPLRYLAKNAATAALVRWRRSAGIAFGGIQVVHIGLIAALLLTVAEPPLEAAMVAVGGVGLLLALVMLVTSFEQPRKAISPATWRIVHKAGFHTFMVIYFYDFVVEPLLLGTWAGYLPWLALTVIGMLLRSYVVLHRMVVRFAHSTGTAAPE